MRVLLVDLESVWRGGQNQALLLLQGLCSRGHEAELLAPSGSALAERARSSGITVHASPPTLRRPRAARRIRRLLRERHFDVVHANEAHALSAAWLAGAHRQTALLASRRVAFRLSTNPFARARYRAARRILAISHFVARSVTDSGFPASLVRVVYDGVDLPPPRTAESRALARQRLRFSGGDPLIGCVGYLLPEKGQEWLLRALPAIRARIPACRLLLVGDGPCRARLEALAEQLGVRSDVEFAGHVNDLAEVYNALDVFVFPSLAEPLGTSLLSAMAYGLPVIAVHSGGIAEALDPSSGILLPGPKPEEIARAAANLLLDPQFSMGLGAAARRVIEQHFTCGHMVEATLQNYSEVMGSARG